MSRFREVLFWSRFSQIALLEAKEFNPSSHYRAPIIDCLLVAPVGAKGVLLKPIFVLLSSVLLTFSAASAKDKMPSTKPAAAQAGAPAQATPSPLLAVVQQEMAREMGILGKTDPPAYFMSYTITDSNRAEVMGSNGALLSSQENHSRWLEAQVRVGSYDLDNTHHVGNGPGDAPGSYGEPIPIEDDAGVLRRAIWRETDSQYRAAADSLIKIKTGKDVQVQTAEEHAPDFSRETPHVFYGPHASFTLDRRPWGEKARLYTKYFHQSPAILNSIATFTAQAQNEYQVSSEGSRLQFGQVRYRLELFIQGKAPDGMDINRYYNFDWTDPSLAPDRACRCAISHSQHRSRHQGHVARPLHPVPASDERALCG